MRRRHFVSPTFPTVLLSNPAIQKEFATTRPPAHPERTRPRQPRPRSYASAHPTPAARLIPSRPAGAHCRRNFHLPAGHPRRYAQGPWRARTRWPSAPGAQGKLALWPPGAQRDGLVPRRTTKNWPCGAPVQLYRPCVPPAYFQLALWHPSSLLQMALWPRDVARMALGVTRPIPAGSLTPTGSCAAPPRQPATGGVPECRARARARHSGNFTTCRRARRSCRARPGWFRWRSARKPRPWTSSAGQGSRRPARPGRP